MSFKNNITAYQAITLSGDTYTLNLTDTGTSYYNFTGTGSLTGNVTIQPSGTPTADGLLFRIYFSGALVKGAFTFTIFGTAITAGQMLTNFVMDCQYVTTTASWETYLNPDFSAAVIGTANIEDGAVTAAKLASDAVTTVKILDANVTAVKLASDSVITAKVLDKNITLPKMADITRGSIIVGGTANAPTLLDAKTNLSILTGDGTDIKSVATAAGDVIPAYSGANLIWTIQSNAVTTSKIAASNITTVKLETNLKYWQINIPVSFESGRQCRNIIYCRNSFTISAAYFSVTKAIAATDNGTITLDINGVAVTTGVITVTSSSALDTVFTCTPTALNTYLVGGTAVALGATTLKTTAGGEGLLTLLMLETPAS